MIRILRIINKNPLISVFTGLIISVVPFGNPSIVSATNADTPEDSVSAHAKRAAPITLKEAKPEDRDQYEGFKVHPNQEDYLDLEQIPEVFEANTLKGLFGAYDKEDSLVGLAYITKTRQGFAIEELAIDKQFQGQGYGKTFLAELMKQLLSEQENATVEAEIDIKNEPSQGLFKSHGFKAQGDPYYDEEDNDFYQLWSKPSVE
jgi:ribosomal protein S18 acetylase RimI-like enzyme